MWLAAIYEYLADFPREHTGKCDVAIEGRRHFLLQRECGPSLGAGASEPPVTNTLEDLKGLWMKEPVVQHQCYYSW